MTAYLGITEVQDAADASRVLVTGSKVDPKSRFMCVFHALQARSSQIHYAYSKPNSYIYAKHSRARLGIRQSMLAEILTFHQVMPEFLDFFTSFGLQSSAREVRFSGFRQQMSIKPQAGKFAIDVLGRSGRQYQVAYNLKGVTLKKYDPDSIQLAEWSIRTAAFYHQFDVVEGRSAWIVVKGGRDVYERYKELTGSDARPEDKAFQTPDECFISSLSPHMLFCRWSAEDWRGYVRWLEEAVDKEVSI
jgi:hypothetical protein